MEMSHSFEIAERPDTVFKYLLDVTRVVECIPGVRDVESSDGANFRGNFRVKVGPVTVNYACTGRIVDSDPINRTTTIYAEGDESGAAGSMRASAVLSVSETSVGSLVSVTTDLALTGKVANFGRGVIDKVSDHLVAQVAQRLKQAIANESAATGRPMSTANSSVAPSEVGSGDLAPSKSETLGVSGRVENLSSPDEPLKLLPVILSLVIDATLHLMKTMRAGAVRVLAHMLRRGK